MRSRSLRVFIILTLLASVLSVSGMTVATPAAAATATTPPPPHQSHPDNPPGRRAPARSGANAAAVTPGNLYAWGYNTESARTVALWMCASHGAVRWERASNQQDSV